MSVNRRKGKYKSAKEFEKDAEKSEDSFVSKTELKNKALALKKFGQELTGLKKSVLEAMPINEVTLKSLMDFEKMTTNLARKRHLMFIGKCLRNENENDIREYLENKEKTNISTMQLNEIESKVEANEPAVSKINELIDTLINADGESIELFLEENQQLERQNLRQQIRNCSSAKDEKKKGIAREKFADYLTLNKVLNLSANDFR